LGRHTRDNAQKSVADAMVAYTKQTSIDPQALLMLGDNWYDELPGGVDDPRWQTDFEQMYPASVFNCPAYAIPGNHDYQTMPASKVAAELAYAARGKTRWTMPSLWYRFEFPKKNPVITFIALDSNMPFSDGSSRKGQDFTLTPTQQAEQLAWLKAELEKPLTTPFLVVMATILSTPTALMETTRFSSATGTHSSRSTTFISTSPDTTMISSISS